LPENSSSIPKQVYRLLAGGAERLMTPTVDYRGGVIS
jgi:hypothetical protein